MKSGGHDTAPPHSLRREWAGQQGTVVLLVYGTGLPASSHEQITGFNCRYSRYLSLQCRWPGIPTSCGNAANSERNGIGVGQCVFLRSVTRSHVTASRTLSVSTSICKLWQLWPSVQVRVWGLCFRAGTAGRPWGHTGVTPAHAPLVDSAYHLFGGLALASPDPPVVIGLNAIVDLHALSDCGKPPVHKGPRPRFPP